MMRILAVIVSFFIIPCLYAQSYTAERLKAIHIYVFANYISLPDSNMADYYAITILGNDNNLFNDLKEVTQSKYIRGKPVTVEMIRKYEEYKKSDILYIVPAMNNDLKSIYQALQGSHTILITENADANYSMINFIFRDNTLRYEINESNLLKENFTISSRLVAMIKSREELQEMYLQSEEFLKTQEKIIEEQKQKIQNQENLLENQILEIKEQKAQIQQQKKAITNQQARIDSQNNVLNDLSSNIKKQQYTLTQKTRQLQEQDKILNQQQADIEQQLIEQRKQEAILKELQLEADQTAELIENQTQVLNRQILLIQKQRNILLLIIGFSLVISALAIQVYRGYRTKKIINDQLKEKNNAIRKQKEEIEYQAKKLEISNKELEKLSIVASKTDNAVIIMNPKGDFEWINDAYTRLYGYTIDDLFEQKGKNILSADQNVNLQDLINIWFKNKETVTLESEKTHKNGRKVWVQTTLTPVLNKNKDIVKLVAIETDISMLKTTEKELIRQMEKSDELLLNILPKQVADDLKDKGEAKPEQFDNVSVMFSDFVDFTRLAHDLEPEVLIGELNEIYTAFDDIIEKYQCERIKTIGDAYMAVCGMHKKPQNSALNLTRACMEIIQYLKERNKTNTLQWKTRIGIHTGSIVGGIVGVRKYIYDIFGDTINVASRMEFHSEIMRINLSEETFRLIHEKIPCVERKPIEVKGKGEMKMYYVDDSKPGNLS